MKKGYDVLACPIESTKELLSQNATKKRRNNAKLVYRIERR